MKIEDLIAELAVFPLNNKIHVKVDGEIRYSGSEDQRIVARCGGSGGVVKHPRE